MGAYDTVKCQNNLRLVRREREREQQLPSCWVGVVRGVFSHVLIDCLVSCSDIWIDFHKPNRSKYKRRHSSISYPSAAVCPWKQRLTELLGRSNEQAVCVCVRVCVTPSFGGNTQQRRSVTYTFRFSQSSVFPQPLPNIFSAPLLNQPVEEIVNR